ncbi:MAG: hypothetical protein MEQ84_07980 [Mesorhizobium sp.]|nr:hypothetical protein [Mesorhizobium sp.]
MSWLSILQLVLQLAAYIARQAERRDIERALTHEIEILQGKRLRAAVDARAAVLDGSVPADPGDTRRRD